MTWPGELGFDLPRRNIEDRPSGGSGGVPGVRKCQQPKKPTLYALWQLKIELGSKATGLLAPKQFAA
jgi:hypothetical protein